MSEPLAHRAPLRLGAPVHPEDRVREGLAMLVGGDRARTLAADARADDRRAARPRHRVLHGVPGGRPPDARVLLDPSRTAALDESVAATCDRDELAVQADDAGLHAARAEVDGEETVAHDQRRVVEASPRCAAANSLSGCTSTR